MKKCHTCGNEIEDGALVCLKCVQVADKKMALSPFNLIVYSILTIVLLAAVSFFASINFAFLICVITGAALLLSVPVYVIVHLIRISLHPGKIKGKFAAIIVLLFWCAIVYNVFYDAVPRAKKWWMGPRQLVCRTNIKELGLGLIVYAYEYDGMLPGANWSDVLVEEFDIDSKSLRCRGSDSVMGESDYCLNINAAGRKLSDLPADMVLLFETEYKPEQGEVRLPISQRESYANNEYLKDIMMSDDNVYLDRWNQVGKPDLIGIDLHEKGVNIFFADGHVEFVKLSRLAELNWGGDYSEVITKQLGPPEPEYIKTYQFFSLSILGFVCISITVLLCIKFRIFNWWVIALGVGILSAGTGWFFGIMSEFAYYLFFRQNVGHVAGAAFGLLTGICFAAILSDFCERFGKHCSFVGLASSTGMLAGMVCSTMVHIVLMITYLEKNPFGLVIGLPFGIFAGAVLGAISGLMFKRFRGVRE